MSICAFGETNKAFRRTSVATYPLLSRLSTLAMIYLLFYIRPTHSLAH